MRVSPEASETDALAHEVELKFDVEPGGAAAVRSAAALADVKPRTRRYDTLYFDTADGALRRAGFSLRVRRAGKRCVQAVKSRKGAAAGLFVRKEWESEVPRFALDRAALRATPLRRWAADLDALVPVVRSRIDRTLWDIAQDGSRIEVVLDEGTIAAGRTTARLSELELELVEGKPAALFALAEAIGAAAPLRLGVLSKGDRGHALAAGLLGRAAKAEPVRLRAPLTEAGAFHAIAHACLRHFRLNEMVLLEARDADALHQARVALRRLRAALSLFRPTVRGKDYQALRDELRWLAGQLGEARNLDVLLVRIDHAGEARPKELTALRERAYDSALAALRSDRARALMLKLILWLETGAWRYRARGAEDLAPLAENRLERRWRRIRRRGQGLARLDEEGRHALRLDIKKLRYAAEFMGPLYAAKPLAARRDRFVAALKVLQDRLGDLNDAWTAEALAARLPAKLRPLIARVHGIGDRAKALRAADKAFHRALAAGGYWSAAG
ncbi:MAG: CYTH and CHAD domain-containing protein [Sphingosinicella sp.]|uniref:CYTH and CHAD domain-containing protein n=1 Tax=Sphingosinicella sp. TaxID=1917971 RepID=UPI004037BE20